MSSPHRPPTVLCLVRHGDAGEPTPLRVRDAERRLSAKGKKQARWAGKALRRLGYDPRDVLSSDLVRAVETAELAARAAKRRDRCARTEALAPHADPAAIVRVLAASLSKPVRDGAAPVVRWLVGHEPHLSRLVEHLTGAPPGGLRFGKGAVAVVEAPEGVAARACRLAALLPPATLREVRRARR
jgi:phosphohistidine phosphatase SixA